MPGNEHGEQHQHDGAEREAHRRTPVFKHIQGHLPGDALRCGLQAGFGRFQGRYPLVQRTRQGLLPVVQVVNQLIGGTTRLGAEIPAKMIGYIRYKLPYHQEALLFFRVR